MNALSEGERRKKLSAFNFFGSANVEVCCSCVCVCCACITASENVGEGRLEKFKKISRE